MGWDVPWYSAADSLDGLLGGRQIGLFHFVCYLRDGDRVFETYWTLNADVSLAGRTPHRPVVAARGRTLRRPDREFAVNADDLQGASATTRSVMASVRPEHMNNPTPCGSWTVRDLLMHMVDAPTFTAVVMETGDSRSHSGAPADPAEGGYLAEYDTATAREIAAFRADGAMSKMVTLPVLGELAGGSFVVLATCDALVHGWDLAKATGLPDKFDADLAAAVFNAVGPLITRQMRGADGTALFEPEVRVPADASPIDRLAGFLGRQP